MAQHRAGQAIMGHAMPNSKGGNVSGKASRAGSWYRSRIITHGFTAGGYKDSSPWKNVNRTDQSNSNIIFTRLTISKISNCSS